MSATDTIGVCPNSSWSSSHATDISSGPHRLAAAQPLPEHPVSLVPACSPLGLLRVYASDPFPWGHQMWLHSQGERAVGTTRKAACWSRHRDPRLLVGKHQLVVSLAQVPLEATSLQPPTAGPRVSLTHAHLFEPRTFHCFSPQIPQSPAIK